MQVGAQAGGVPQALLRTSPRRTRSGTRSRRRRATSTRSTPTRPTSRSRRSSRTSRMQPGAHRRDQGRARPRASSATRSRPTTSRPRARSRRPRPRAGSCSSSGVAFEDFNSYGSRRGNDRVMTRGTFANVRIKNLMLGRRGGRQHAPPAGGRRSCRSTTPPWIPEARARRWSSSPGQEYGTGSSRDWAAKGTKLLGVKAVVAQSFERIHRSNLVGMGVLPLQFKEGTTAADAAASTAPRPTTCSALGRVPEAPAGPDAAHHPQGRRDRGRSGALPHRHPDRDRLLPARRDPALRPPRKSCAKIVIRPRSRQSRFSWSTPIPTRWSSGSRAGPVSCNSACLRDFMAQMLKSGKDAVRHRLPAGAPAWTARSSGVLAGVALELRKSAPKGSLVLAADRAAQPRARAQPRASTGC